MRVFAIVLMLGVLALAVVLIARRDFPTPDSTQNQRLTRTRHTHRRPPPELQPAPGEPDTTAPPNPRQAAPDGFYLGKGGERVYINYGTPDPVLRSLLHSVMENSSDPNEQGKQIYQRI